MPDGAIDKGWHHAQLTTVFEDGSRFRGNTEGGIVEKRNLAVGMQHAFRPAKHTCGGSAQAGQPAGNIAAPVKLAQLNQIQQVHQHNIVVHGRAFKVPAILEQLLVELLVQ